MGKRSRKRAGAAAPVSTTDYTDPEGNVLTLRDTTAKVPEPHQSAASSADDAWRRRTELLFERYAVRWVIAGLPLEKQKELLGRYRMADQATQQWVRATIDRHIDATLE